jgi:predicted kinase
VVRKELAGLAVPAQVSAPFGEGIYTPEWNDRTYADCLRRAELLLFEGKRVLVDASFREEKRRRTFLEAATAWGVPGVFFLCTADPETVRGRLQERRDDASDADWSIYQMVAKSWQKPSIPIGLNLWEIPTNGSKEQAVSLAVQKLQEHGLHD